MRISDWSSDVCSSDLHEDMRKVLQGLTGNSVRVARSSRFTVAVSRRRNDSDESYVIELCNELLRQQALTQHCFDFLRGDPGQRGRGRMLPVEIGRAHV